MTVKKTRPTMKRRISTRAAPELVSSVMLAPAERVGKTVACLLYVTGDSTVTSWVGGFAVLIPNYSSSIKRGCIHRSRRVVISLQICGAMEMEATAGRTEGSEN